VIDPARKLARVQPGTVLDVLRSRAEEHHLTFAPDPSTHNHNTLGGMIGNNSCGVHSLMGLGTGRTSDQVHELGILLYDGTRLTVGATTEEELKRIIRAGGRRGQIYAQLKALRDRYADEIRRRYPKNLPRRVSGYNLDDLLPEKGFASAGRRQALSNAGRPLDPAHDAVVRPGDVCGVVPPPRAAQCR
jgi:FAD/FMN-containing dehydrogenase